MPEDEILRLAAERVAARADTRDDDYPAAVEREVARIREALAGN